MVLAIRYRKTTQISQTDDTYRNTYMRPGSNCNSDVSANENAAGNIQARNQFAQEKIQD